MGAGRAGWADNARDRKEDLATWERCSQLWQRSHSDLSIEVDGQSIAFNSNEKTQAQSCMYCRAVLFLPLHLEMNALIITHIKNNFVGGKRCKIYVLSQYGGDFCAVFHLYVSNLVKTENVWFQISK